MNTKILEDFQICIVVPLKHLVATKKSKSFVNLGNGIGIGYGIGTGTDITNVIIPSFIRPIDPILSMVVT